MRLAEITLRRSCVGFEEESHVYVCLEVLHELFDLPYSAKRISLVMFDRPSRNRVEVRRYDDNNYVLVDGRFHWLYGAASEWLADHMRDHVFYAEVRY